jgi:hypothetical protein
MELRFDIGSSVPVKLEKWQQMKNGAGSLTDTLVSSYGAYANIDNVRTSRSYENNQTKQSERYDIVVRKKILEGQDVSVQWKVVFRGKRHSVVAKKILNKRMCDFLLTIEAK